MATQQTQKTSSVREAALTLSVLLVLAGGLNQMACSLSDFLGIAFKALLTALPSALPVLWHALQPCVLGHQSALDGLLPISVSCCQLVLTLSAVA